MSGGSQLGYVSGTQTNLQIQGNDYWTNGGAFSVKYSTKTFSSLAAFRSGANQEMLKGSPVGLNVNPLLNNPGNGGTIGNADLLYTLSAYQLQSGSHLIDSGLNLASLFGINPGPQDFFGNPLPDSSGGYDIGAA